MTEQPCARRRIEPRFARPTKTQMPGRVRPGPRTIRRTSSVVETQFTPNTGWRLHLPNHAPNLLRLSLRPCSSTSEYPAPFHPDRIGPEQSPCHPCSFILIPCGTTSTPYHADPQLLTPNPGPPYDSLGAPSVCDLPRSTASPKTPPGPYRDSTRYAFAPVRPRRTHPAS
jgi:hypothetical protein